MNCIHDMVDNIHQKRISRPWHQCRSICLHLRCHIWNSCTSGMSRHRDTRKLPLEQRPKFHRAGYPIEKHSICHLYWKGQCASEIQLLNTPHDQLRCRHGKQMTPVLAQFDFTRSVSCKNWHAHFHDRGWGDCDTCHQDNVVTSQWRLRLL